MSQLNPDYSSLEDEFLVAEMARGKVEAFDELYRRFSRRLLIYFNRMLGDEDKAQDFLQDLFMKIIEKPHAFRARSSFSAWIFTIASNMCKNEYRRLNVREVVTNYQDMDLLAGRSEIQIDSAIDELEFKRHLLAELDTLGIEKKNTFLLRFQEQFSIKEISFILGCSEGTVKSRLFYTARQLAQKLQVFAPVKCRGKTK